MLLLYLFVPPIDTKIKLKRLISIVFWLTLRSFKKCPNTYARNYTHKHIHTHRYIHRHLSSNRFWNCVTPNFFHSSVIRWRNPSEARWNFFKRRGKYFRRCFAFGRFPFNWGYVNSFIMRNPEFPWFSNRSGRR